MSTAVLMSGQFRSFGQCFATQHWHVNRRFPDPHFFLVMQDTLPVAAAPNAPPPINAQALVKLLTDKYGADHVHAKLIQDPTDLPMIPKKFGLYAPYENAAPHPQLMMQHWYQNEAWKWFLEQRGETKFDLFVRQRGDNFFHGMTMQPIAPRSVYSPWWGRFGGINDRFAIMDEAAASVYFRVYEKIDELLKLGCPFHPESLLKATLELGGVASVDRLLAEFYTCRVTGQHRTMETMPVDMAHIAIDPTDAIVR